MPQELIEMAKDLVMELVRTHHLSPEDMQQELKSTYASLKAMQATEAGGQTSGEGGAALDWRHSIKRHSVSCLVCGAVFKQLSARHLSTHDLDPRTYRERFGIPRSQPLSAKATTALRKRIVNDIRPWEQAPTYQKSRGQEVTPEPAAAPKRAGRKKAATRA